ncbi:hypothetical protein C8J56DRAFT_479513 [Mycena floridula]|nr:hypothetical protein C8J56DRAFT_479513 [Mycena floridula]
MQVDIPALLASSSLPTEAERAYLNQLLNTSNDEISRLTAAIDKLVLEREALQCNVVSYKAILAPIRRLPEDMLREIFVSCLPSNKAAAIAITEAPLLLGRICLSWREIALSTPALWASIHVHILHFLGLADVQAPAALPGSPDLACTVWDVSFDNPSNIEDLMTPLCWISSNH